jgi:hypothetical protein
MLPSGVTVPLTRLFDLSATLARQVRLLGLVAVASGMWLGYLLLRPVAFHAWWVTGLSGLGLMLLAVPGIAALVLSWGLADLARVPQRTAELAQATRERSAALRSIGASGPGVRRGWLLGRRLYDVWGLMRESRDLLFSTSALVRMANPVSLVVALAVIAVAALVTAAGVLAGLVVVVAALV